MAGTLVHRARSGRFSRTTSPSDPMLAALAEHAARLTGARQAALSLGRDGRAGDAIVSTSQDPWWLGVVGRLDVRAGPQVRPEGARTVAAVAIPAAQGSGALAVATDAEGGFSKPDLERLQDVARLAAVAVDQQGDGHAPPPRRERRPEPGDAAAIRFSPHRLPKAFERLEGLPALSESRRSLLAALEEQTPSPQAIVAVIESDIALLIAILRLANTVRSGRRPTVWTVPEAVRVLTPDGIAAMARRMTVFDFFQRVRGWAVPPEHFRLHAVITQRAALRLARMVDHPEPDQLVVAALLHDIGKLVLMEILPGYPEALGGEGRTPEERLKAERRTVGLDHEMAGGVLLRRWRMPERLAEIVGRHHTGVDDRDAGLLRLADALAHYVQGRPISPPDLLAAARAVDIDPAQLRAVMFELPQPQGGGRFRAVEPSPLTPRETEMLRELAKGSTYKQIGEAVGLKPSTVRTHLHNVYRKCGVVDRAQAVLAATERGWL